MKNLLLFLSFLIAIALQAQDLWTPMAAIPTDSEYYVPSLAVADENTIWITTITMTGNEMTHHWHLSTDGGNSWTTGIIPLESNAIGISDIEAVSATTAYIAFHSPMLTEAGAIWKTENSGLTWAKVPGLFETVGSSFPNFIHFFDENHGICVGDPVLDYFEIYTTSDAGANWTRVPAANIPPRFNAEFGLIESFEVRDGSLWFNTNMGRILHSTDAGLSWQVNNTPIIDIGQIPYIDYAFSDANNGILVSDYGQYFKTTDAGVTLTEYFPSSNDFALRRPPIWYIPQSSTSYFSGGRDTEFEERGSSLSADDGVTWHNLNLIDPNPIVPKRAWFKNEDLAYCVGTYVSQEGLPGQYQFFKHDSSNLGFRAALGLKKFGSEKFAISPNPADNLVKISGATVNSVLVFDGSGKIVLTRNFNTSAEIYIDISSLQRGIYFAKITSDCGETEMLKVLKI